MENKLKIMAAGLGLAGLVNISCGNEFEQEKLLFECEAGDARVKIVEEVLNYNFDERRIEVYNKNDKPILMIRRYPTGIVYCNDGMRTIYDGNVAKTKP